MGTVSAPLIVSASVAAELFGLGVHEADLPPGVIIAVDAPARWPLGKPWPPKVTVPGKPCWRCVAGTPSPRPLDHLRLLEKK